MPAFNTHWMVAILCRNFASQAVKQGFNAYKDAANTLRTTLVSQFEYISSRTTKKEAQAAYQAFIKSGDDGVFNIAINKFENNLKQQAVYDNVTCFSAYMLGACGPDLWTVPCPGFKTAGIHFDMGHYNRTTHQFKVAIKRWKEKKKSDKNYTNSLQYKVELSYFLGMATHIATDVVVHQLVNVYAGAYNLLESKWESEHGALAGLKNLWNTHNKVEHFWDSYIRYRYLGDYSYIWKGEDDDKKKELMEPLWFPTAENLIEHLNRMKEFDLKSDLISWLKSKDRKYKIEKPFILPRVVCDRITQRQGVSPFIYDVVVNKDTGAFPKNEVFKDAEKEAKSKQMKAGKQIGEYNKLAYFSSKNNFSDPTDSFNYLNYFVCPNLERIKEYGLNVFYHLEALKPFVESAVKVAEYFLNGLNRAVSKSDELNIGPLDHFWNLDTGLGLEVRNIAGHTPYEVITQLNFIHITDFIKDAEIKYSNYAANLYCMTGGKGKTKDKSAEFRGNLSKKTHAFEIYAQDKPFKDIFEVEEEEFPDEIRYVEQIKLKNPEFYKSSITLDQYFDPTKKAEKGFWQVVTEFFKSENKAQMRSINHRLSLRFESAIPHLQKNMASEELGFYLYGDDSMKCVQYKEHRGKEWLADKKTTVQDYDYSNQSHYRNLLRFKTQMLLNFENDKDIKRKISPGEWNNTINYKANQKAYSRNYAISTGRKHVLHPDGDGNFWADKDFTHYKNLSPTEHIFFSIYLLVRTQDGVFDMLSKEKISKDDLETIKKIDCLGFVKIVLFYTMDQISDHKSAAMLNECYVDGLKVPVVTA
ncbi:MAG: zinc dependent phospholipase C family protein [Desulfobacteraceae bacterium]|nr:zinc dependent phospholipase C family protein [Desulfobacteraceae bacterium]